MTGIDFFSQLKIYVTTPLSCTSKLSIYVTMISNFFIVMINKFFANPTNITQLKFFFFVAYDQIFVFLLIFGFLQYSYKSMNCFNKFISSVFTPKNNNRLTKSIINANNFVSKTTRNVNLIFFLCRTFHKFQHLLKYTQNQHKF